MSHLVISKVIDKVSTGWRAVGITVALAGATLAAGKSFVSLLHTPQLIVSHDSTMRAANDTTEQIARESLKQLKLTNCILLGLESKLACSLHASH
jgi:hypothetical protein